MAASQPAPPPVETGRPLVHGLAAEIRRRVMTGEIGIGAWLRQETLAKEFGVSRTPVREALQKLEAVGVLELVPNRGALVRGPTVRQIRETYQVRAELEGLAASLAAARIQPHEVEQLRAVQADYRETIEEVGRAGHDRPVPWDGNEPWQHGDTLFHHTIMAVAGNETLPGVIAGLNLGYPSNLSWGPAREVPRGLALSLAEHEAVLDALEQAAPDDARDAMINHVQLAGERVADWFERQSQVPPDSEEART